jgi:hypothetical protein|tara:strand:- start:13 stop:594 length:582 start_codon:yes stop_codon:yes gene_type:complete
MARPTKHNVDYFSHDTMMRNDLRIKALRRKYGHTGYSIWNMLLELLADCEYFEFEWNEFNIELLSPDFDLDSEEIIEIVNYCIKMKLLQIENGYLTCQQLSNRLMDTVLVRRKDFDINNSKRINNNLVNVNNNSFDVNINGQSKVKESKLKQSKEKERIVNEREGNSLVPINKLFSQSPPSSQEINSLDEIIN